MKNRKLRIAFSATCGIICLLLIALWARSYLWWDSIECLVMGNRFVCVQSVIGRAKGSVAILGDNQSATWAMYNVSGEDCDNFSWFDFPGPFGGFNFTSDAKGNGVVVPYWFLVAVPACATIVSIPGPCRFSLRTLLIATTLVAVVLGLVIFARGNQTH